MKVIHFWSKSVNKILLKVMVKSTVSRMFISVGDRVLLGGASQF